MAYVTNNNQAAGLGQLSPVHAASMLSNGGDFLRILTQLYEEPSKLLKEYADPASSTMEINGFGVMDKNSTATSLAIGVQITRFDSQLTTLLSGMEFTLKTLPQKADALWG
jgi:hypothetical protein